MDTNDIIKLSPAQRVAAANEAKFIGNAKNWIAREGRRFKEHYGYDMLPEIAKPGFSLREARRQLRERFKLSEAVTTSQLFALTTGLVTQDLSNAYQIVPTVYRKLAKIVPSTKAEETYFPLQRADIPVPVGETEAAPESRLGGVLTRIANHKFARVIVMSQEMEQDDQTGQIRDQANGIGEGMGYAEEQWWVSQLFAAYVAANIRSSGGIIPPMCIAGQAPSNYGGPTCTAGAVSQANIENLFTAADYVTDLEGNFALVQINAGLFASADKIAVKRIMQSVYMPSTPSASAGVVGGIFSDNVLKGEFETYFTPFIVRARAGIASGNPWGLGEAGKIGAFQDRTPLEVRMEDPNAGKSFDEDTVRIKTKRRFGAGVVLPEFFLAGN